MKYTRPGAPFELVLTQAPTGLVGTLGVRIVKKGSTVSARQTAGIIEYPAGSGIYQYPHAGLSQVGYYAAVWDDGVVSPTHVAVEDINVTTAQNASELTVEPGASFDVTAANWPTGLTGTLKVSVIDNAGNTVTPSSAAGISEYPAGSGLYWVTMTAPLVVGEYSIVWDDGSLTPGHDQATSLIVALPAPSGGGVGPVLPSPTGGPMMPWLAFCDTEVANAARVASYISRGLAPSGHYVAYPANLPSILWRTHGTAETFTDPATDSADWYDPLVVESSDFLGFICDRVTGFDSTETRTSTASSAYRGGSILDAATLPERELVLHGYLVASSEPGIEYGRRWLAKVLGASPTPCADCDLQLRITAPPDDATNDQQGLWRLYRVALRSIQVTDPYRCPDLREVTITLVAADPVLYKDPTVCVDHELLSPSALDGSTCIDFDRWMCGEPLDAPICCTIQPRTIGNVAALITISPEAEYFGGCRITMGDICPGTSNTEADAEVHVGPLPLGSMMTIDAAQHRVVYTDPSGATWDGVPYLTLPPGKAVPWVDLPPSGSDVCVCIEPLAPCSGGGGTFVTIRTQVWER